MQMSILIESRALWFSILLKFRRVMEFSVEMQSFDLNTKKIAYDNYYIPFHKAEKCSIATE